MNFLDGSLYTENQQPLIITAAQINDMFKSVGQALDKVAKRRV